jgi:hypothetical protein
LLSPLRLPQNRGEGLQARLETADAPPVDINSEPFAAPLGYCADSSAAFVNKLIGFSGGARFRCDGHARADPDASAAKIAARRGAAPRRATRRCI